MVSVVVDLVVVDGQVVAVVVGVKAISGVVVHLVPPPVSTLVPVRVDSEMVVVDVRVVDVAVDVDIVENAGVALVFAVPPNLLGCVVFVIWGLCRRGWYGEDGRATIYCVFCLVAEAAL